MENYTYWHKNTTDLRCPHCKKGYLTFDNKNSSEFQSEQNKRMSQFSMPDGSLEDDEEKYSGIISGYLECNHGDCVEKVSFVGQTEYQPDYFTDEDGDEHEHSVKTISFKYFIPPIHIVELKHEYPPELQEILEESFALYFASPSACVNTLRILLEKLCELNGIEKKKSDGDFKSLNKKLDELIFDKSIKDLLEAAKWIGNDGSHSTETITMKNTDLAYRFVVKALDLIYLEDDNQELQKQAQAINKNKGINKSK